MNAPSLFLHLPQAISSLVMLETGLVQVLGVSLMRTQVPSPCDTSFTYKVVKMVWAWATAASLARPRRKESVGFMVTKYIP